MPFNISNFSSVIGSGTRANLFEVTISTPNIGAGPTANFKTLAKSTSLPSSTIGLIDIPYTAGRRLKVAGDRTYADWTVTLMSDSALELRSALEDYQNILVKIDGVATTVGNRGNSNRATLTVKQLGDDATVLRTYTLNNAFPSDISTIDLSYDTRDSIEEFTVTWTYEYFTLG